MEFKKLIDVIHKPISGEWGSVPGNKPTKIIRTTNFTNNGFLNLEKEVVLREISEKKVQSKKLNFGDTIIEKSGGGPKQPVGRVVYFDIKDDIPYLCNNFTSILRVKNKEELDSRFLFYYLFDAHQRGITLNFQNKTTGIINLKLTRLLETIKIPLPSLATQQYIVQVLDKAQALKANLQAQLSDYEKMGESLFLEMFGDPVVNPMGWEEVIFKTIISKIGSGWSPVCDNVNRASEEEWAVLKLGAVTYRVFNPSEHKVLPTNETSKPNIEVKVGDLLFSRKNTRHLVGACVYVSETPKRLMLPDTVFRLEYKEELVEPIFLWYLINNSNYKQEIQRLATGSSGSMPNISKKKLLDKRLYLPPLKLQNQFAKSIQNLEAEKQALQAQLAEAEALFNKLLQMAFKGELLP